MRVEVDLGRELPMGRQKRTKAEILGWLLFWAAMQYYSLLLTSTFCYLQVFGGLLK